MGVAGAGEVLGDLEPVDNCINSVLGQGSDGSTIDAKMTSEPVSGGGADGRIQSQIREVAREGSLQHSNRVGLTPCSELSLDVRTKSCFLYIFS